MRDGHHSPIVEANLVPDHRHELDGGVGGEAEVPLLSLRSVVPAHAPPLVVVLRVGNGKVVVPPAEQCITLRLGLINYEERGNFRKIKKANKGENRELK